MVLVNFSYVTYYLADDESESDDEESESEKTKLARTSTKFFVSRRSMPFLSLPFRITLSTTSSAGSSSSDLAKICRITEIGFVRNGCHVRQS